jgi:hypothetical protein
MASRKSSIPAQLVLIFAGILAGILAYKWRPIVLVLYFLMLLFPIRENSPIWPQIYAVSKRNRIILWATFVMYVAGWVIDMQVHRAEDHIIWFKGMIIVSALLSIIILIEEIYHNIRSNWRRN